jgi:hypothetical protein
MNRTEIEQAVLKEIHTLPLHKAEEALSFILTLKRKSSKKRPLGLLKVRWNLPLTRTLKSRMKSFYNREQLFA